MKNLKKLWKSVLTLVLTVAMIGTSQAVLAAETTANAASYTYTVNLYAANQGSFSGNGGVSVDGTSGVVTAAADKITITGLKYGDVLILNAGATGAVSLGSDSKYYVRGVRESGRDNNTVSVSAFTVKADSEYVVAYGIKGNQVAYTVNYQDASGNELAASETYYGNIGDKPVVAYRYINGYQPQSYNLTKTLSSDASQNVFTFVYTSVASATTPDDNTNGTTTESGTTGTITQDTTTTGNGTTGNGGTTGTITNNGTTGTTGTTGTGNAGTANAGNGTGTAGTGNAGTGADANAAGDGAGADANAAGDGANAAGDGTDEGTTGPEELTNLDEQDVPLADGQQDNAVRETSVMPIVAGVLVALLAVASIAFVLLKMRKQKSAGNSEKKD